MKKFDLLAFSSIDESEVDTLFKIYLDTKLVGFTQQARVRPYKSAVAQFRTGVLDPYTADHELTPHERTLVEPTAKANDKQFSVARAFLYWFDLRADYWANNPPTEELLRIIVPQLDLVALQRQAEILRERLGAAAGYHELGFIERSGVLFDIIAVDPDVHRPGRAEDLDGRERSHPNSRSRKGRSGRSVGKSRTRGR